MSFVDTRNTYSHTGQYLQSVIIEERGILPSSKPCMENLLSTDPYRNFLTPRPFVRPQSAISKISVPSNAKYMKMNYR